MTSNTFIKIKRLTKPTPQPQSSSQVNEQLEVEPTQSLEIKQIEQTASAVKLEPLAEVVPQSVCSSRWSVTGLLNEFSEQ